MDGITTFAKPVERGQVSDSYLRGMSMSRLVLIAAGILAPLIIAAPARAQTAARHYDCSKAGNANKSVCKGAPRCRASIAHHSKRVTAQL